ncbi:hypothetical protein LTS18_001041, partial [Coniosporium uncinatum]
MSSQFIPSAVRLPHSDHHKATESKSRPGLSRLLSARRGATTLQRKAAGNTSNPSYDWIGQTQEFLQPSFATMCLASNVEERPSTSLSASFSRQASTSTRSAVSDKAPPSLSSSTGSTPASPNNVPLTPVSDTSSQDGETISDKARQSPPSRAIFSPTKETFFIPSIRSTSPDPYDMYPSPRPSTSASRPRLQSRRASSLFHYLSPSTASAAADASTISPPSSSSSPSTATPTWPFLTPAPSKENNYLGLCKGSWLLSSSKGDPTAGLALKRRPEGLYNNVKIWQCRHCAFMGNVFGNGKTVPYGKDPNVYVHAETGVR